jgi:hypothetical protein
MVMEDNVREFLELEKSIKRSVESAENERAIKVNSLKGEEDHWIQGYENSKMAEFDDYKRDVSSSFIINLFVLIDDQRPRQKKPRQYR